MEVLKQIAKELRLTRLLAGAEKPLDVLFDYSVKLIKQERYPEALELLQEALLYADIPEIHSNMAFVSSRLHNYDQAIDHYRQSLKLRPNHPGTLHDLSLELLRVGQYAEGWKLFENRNIFDTGFSDRYVKGRIPRWVGEDLTGKRIYISKEQGFGDAIQFVRYLPALLEFVEHVTWLCEPALLKLFQQSFDSDKVTFVDSFDSAPECDYWLYQMSLPLVCPAGKKAYIKADKTELTLPVGTKVGLAWKGNSRHANDANRSLKLDQFNNLPKIQYVSLQKLNPDVYEIQRSPCNIYDAASRIGDFDETASVIDQLDLVIAVDTAIAHLTGSLGKPCWVILPYLGSDWRWGPYGTKTTELYENMRLYWMPAPNTLPLDLIEDLTEFIAQRQKML
jgi:hypothetical protein